MHQLILISKRFREGPSDIKNGTRLPCLIKISPIISQANDWNRRNGPF